jgi:hypothetical protein
MTTAPQGMTAEEVIEALAAIADDIDLEAVLLKDQFEKELAEDEAKALRAAISLIQSQASELAGLRKAARQSDPHWMLHAEDQP